MSDNNDSGEELENNDDLELVKRMQEGQKQIVSELRKIIIGQETVVD